MRGGGPPPKTLRPATTLRALLRARELRRIGCTDGRATSTSPPRASGDDDGGARSDRALLRGRTVAIADVTSRLAAKSVHRRDADEPARRFYRIAYRTVPRGRRRRCLDGAGLPADGASLTPAPRRRRRPPDRRDRGLVRAVAHAGRTSTTSRSPGRRGGFAVVASDFAGLGNGGTQGYVANHDTAHSVLDSAARSARCSTRARSTTACSSSATAREAARCWRRRGSPEARGGRDHLRGRRLRGGVFRV